MYICAFLKLNQIGKIFKFAIDKGEKAVYNQGEKERFALLRDLSRIIIEMQENVQ